MDPDQNDKTVRHNFISLYALLSANSFRSSDFHTFQNLRALLNTAIFSGNTVSSGITDMSETITCIISVHCYLFLFILVFVQASKSIPSLVSFELIGIDNNTCTFSSMKVSNVALFVLHHLLATKENLYIEKTR